MGIETVTAGKNAPDEVNVIIEIAQNAHPVKYEIDKDTGMLAVDRFMNTAMFYPCNYGYVPSTLSDDGDPVDVLVLTPYPVQPGSLIRSRPVAMLGMSDEKGEDAKILAVPADKISNSLYADVRDLEDVPAYLKHQISHFFEHYKDLEHGKWVRIDQWHNAAAAREEITASIERAASG
jgi:inorganic pyrophosphatase